MNKMCPSVKAELPNFFTINFWNMFTKASHLLPDLVVTNSKKPTANWLVPKNYSMPANTEVS